MFQFQNHGMARKRGRDDDSDSDFDDDHYFKKIKSWSNDGFSFTQLPIQIPPPSSLPHRPSVTPSPPRLVTDTEAMTPVQSDDGGVHTPDSLHREPLLHTQDSTGMDFDMDMDMEEEDADVRSQPPESPAFSQFGTSFLRPAMLNPTLFSSEPPTLSGRMPTPIHPTFKRGGMNGLGYPTSGSAGGMGSLPSPIQAPAPITSARKTNWQETEDRSRRMPSPISEDEDIPDTPTALTQSQLSRLSFSQSNTDAMDTVPTVTLGMPPTPRGRKRSGALTGMGRFSMGYRDDCEKCRQKVPGHYSHFLP